MNPHIRWDGEGKAELTLLEGENVAVRSTRPYAPGSRPQGKLASGSAFRMKTHRCRKVEGELYLVEGRVLDLTRSVRPELEALLGVTPPTAGEPSR